MKMDAHILKNTLIALVLIALLGATGCEAKPPQAPGLRVTGAYDMIPLANAVQKEFQQSTKITMTIEPSKTGLQALKSGDSDILILGREPKPDEMQNLQDTIVGYDAVCILISTRTYNGGLQKMDNSLSGGLIIQQAKFKGIQNFSIGQLKNWVGNLLQVNYGETHWFLNNPAYFTFQGYYDPITNAPSVKKDNPKELSGTWVWNAVDFQGENLPPGKFDTQTILLDKIGFSENLLKNVRLSFVPDLFNTEEELISARFQVQASPQQVAQTSAYPFEFYILQASRRVTVRALQHGFFLKALSIEGIDPLSDPAVIYKGTYPLSRKIHIITRQPVTPDAQKFIDFLISQQGQALISSAQFLPLPPTP
jgi:hypothetical protein